METFMNILETKFELKRAIENSIKETISVFENESNININPIIYFSPDLRVIAVNLQHTSSVPFFMNIDILRNLEKAVGYFHDHQPLASKGYNLAEQATVDPNSLNRIGRLHKEKTELAYQTNTAFIFTCSQTNVNTLLLELHTALIHKKDKPVFIEQVQSQTPDNKIFKHGDSFNFINSSKNNHIKLHDQKTFSILFNESKQQSLTTVQGSTPIVHTNSIVLGYTLNLSKQEKMATLHVPSQFLDEYRPHPAARLYGADQSKECFKYYDWFIGEDQIIKTLQNTAFNSNQKHKILDALNSFKRHDVEITSIDVHCVDFEIPTANYSQINQISFITTWLNNQGLHENYLVTVMPEAIKIFNSKMISVYPPDCAISAMHKLKAFSAELFINNRLYAFEQINQFRKTIGGFNQGLAKQQDHIYII